MEKFNLLANRMTDQPPFHAAVELQKTADGWFYGYLIILKESFRRLPLPVRATAATAQRGEISREIALVFARDEAARKMEQIAATALLKNRAEILRNENTRSRLSHILPKKLQSYLKSGETRSSAAPKVRHEQLSLFG